MPNDAMRDKQRGLGDGRPSEWNLHDGDDPDEALRGLEQALGQMDACVQAQREGGGSLLQASRATFESLPKAQACLAVLAQRWEVAGDLLRGREAAVAHARHLQGAVDSLAARLRQGSPSRRASAELEGALGAVQAEASKLSSAVLTPGKPPLPTPAASLPPVDEAEAKTEAVAAAAAEDAARAAAALLEAKAETKGLRERLAGAEREVAEHKRMRADLEERIRDLEDQLRDLVTTLFPASRARAAPGAGASPVAELWAQVEGLQRALDEERQLRQAAEQALQKSVGLLNNASRGVSGGGAPASPTGAPGDDFVVVPAGMLEQFQSDLAGLTSSMGDLSPGAEGAEAAEADADDIRRILARGMDELDLDVRRATAGLGAAAPADGEAGPLDLEGDLWQQVQDAAKPLRAKLKDMEASLKDWQTVGRDQLQQQSRRAAGDADPPLSPSVTELENENRELKQALEAAAEVEQCLQRSLINLVRGGARGKGGQRLTRTATDPQAPLTTPVPRRVEAFDIEK